MSDPTFTDDDAGFHSNHGTVELIGRAGMILGGGESKQTHGTISIDAVPLNGLSLMYDTVLTPKISLNLQGITISCGPPLMPSITMGATGITMTVAEVFKIEMGPTGITLSAGPAASLQIGPDGITLNGVKIGITGFTGIDLAGLKLTSTMGTTTTLM